MRVTWLSFLLISTITTAGYFFWYKTRFGHANKNYSFPDMEVKVAKAADLRLKETAADMRNYVEAGNYNSSICFLLDMRISSGKKRFFVYNLEKDSVELAGLVTHGSGSGDSDSDLYFSNEPGSNCTSLGKYKIGKSYYGQFGLAYKLYGLDKTNNKAFERFVVLHAHSCVPESEVYPWAICRSWGCPTVSPFFLQSLRKYIDVSEKPILLNIYK